MSLPTLDRVLDAVLRIDTDFQIKFVSEAGRQWFGQRAGEDFPSHFVDILHEQDVDRFKRILADGPEHFCCDLRMRKNGDECWANVRGYQLTGVRQYVICIIDISSWKLEDKALRHAAEHDDLTGLPNRAFLKNAVSDLIGSNAPEFSIALLDLDGFKKVNDTFGHAMGDAVLIETTRRLLKIMGPNDVLARLGGDEFVVLFSDRNAVGAQSVLSNVLLAIARPYDTAPHDAYLGVSVGVAEYPHHGQDYSTVLKNADIAMYYSKNAGKNRISVYTPSVANVDFSIKAAIHNGIQDGEFYMDFQPQFDIDRNLIGAEALMRWKSRNFGIVSPDKFIPIAEASGLMPFLGTWALRYSCHQLKKFHLTMPNFVMSVNVSPVQVGTGDFDTVVLDVIQEVGIDPTKLVLEITESTMMQSQQRTERTLANLRDRGIRFSIDDFGTGFSSLAYLTRLPVSSIKIDKAFVTAIEDEKRTTRTDRQLIAAMINLAHSIDLEVVAEGVETQAQLAFLREAGCDFVQGYLLGKPMTAGTMGEQLQKSIEANA
jgi:diguanylate cyclase (GGDEF)-like protein